MSINQDQFIAANKAAVDSLMAVANAALSSAERIAALNLDTARSTLEQSVSGAKALAGAKNAQEAAAIQASLAQPGIEQAVAYSRSVYEITSEAQQQLAKVVESQYGEFQKSLNGMMAQALKSAPAGSETVIANFQNALASANTAFGNMNAMAKQISETAQANIAAAFKAGK